MATTTEQARTLVSRAVIWTGIALGTCLAILAITDGPRLRIGGMPSVLGVILGAVMTWALIVLAAVTLAELVRRHHRTAGRYALKQGKRGTVATARHGMTVHTWLVSKAAPRWENRAHRPLMFRKVRQDEATGTRRVDGKPETDADKRFFDLRESGYTGPVNQDGYAVSDPPANTPGGPVSAPVSRIKTEHRAQRAAARSGGTVPSEWGPVIAQTADFEPEDDGALLEWMTRQVTGLSAWAEALVDFYEHCTGVVGIDPKASAMLHDVADAAAGAAETMGAAKARFTEHYELPREFAANGGLMTHDGRWVTGEGA